MTSFHVSNLPVLLVQLKTNTSNLGLTSPNLSYDNIINLILVAYLYMELAKF